MRSRDIEQHNYCNKRIVDVQPSGVCELIKPAQEGHIAAAWLGPDLPLTLTLTLDCLWSQRL